MFVASQKLLRHRTSQRSSRHIACSAWRARAKESRQSRTSPTWTRQTNQNVEASNHSRRSSDVSETRLTKEKVISQVCSILSVATPRGLTPAKNRSHSLNDREISRRKIPFKTPQADCPICKRLQSLFPQHPCSKNEL